MIIEDLKVDIEKYIESNYKPQILIVTKKPSKKYALYQFNADSDFLNPLYKEYKDNILLALNGKVINNFELDHSEDESIEEIEISEVPEYNQINTILNGKAEDLCNDKKFRIKDITFVVVKFFIEEKTMTIFSKYKGGKSLLKSQKAFIGGEKLEKFDKEILYFSGNIDALEINDKIYIFNRSSFLNMFSLKDVYYQVIESNKKRIVEYNIFDNATDLIEYCQSNGNYIRKFCKIVLTEGFKSLKENISNVPNVVQEYNLTNIQLDAEGRIIYSGKESVSEILNLLSKHYVKNALNNEKLIAKALQNYNSKDSEAGEAV